MGSRFEARVVVMAALCGVVACGGSHSEPAASAVGEAGPGGAGGGPMIAPGAGGTGGGEIAAGGGSSLGGANGGGGMPSDGDCPAGQTGAAPSCVDIDECTLDNGGCGALSSCTNADTSGAPPLCGPSRPAIDRLEPSSNPPGSFILIVGSSIDRASTSEIRVGGQPLPEASILWPPAGERFAGSVAIQLPESLTAGSSIDVAIANGAGISSPASLQVLPTFPAGPWPPETWVFPSPVDERGVPIVTVDPVSASAANGPGYRYDFDGNASNGGDLQSTCVASFIGEECLDEEVVGDDDSPTRSFCQLDPDLDVDDDETRGTCVLRNDPLFGSLPDAVLMCCEGGDPTTTDCDGALTPCADASCTGCDDTAEFVPCSPFSGSWDFDVSNRLQLTVMRSSGAVAYVGECSGRDEDFAPDQPGMQRPCDLLLRDPDGRQLFLPIDFPVQACE
jgi:hypothetical protein